MLARWRRKADRPYRRSVATAGGRLPEDEPHPFQIVAGSQGPVGELGGYVYEAVPCLAVIAR